MLRSGNFAAVARIRRNGGIGFIVYGEKNFVIGIILTAEALEIFD